MANGAPVAVIWTAPQKQLPWYFLGSFDDMIISPTLYFASPAV
jgi:hypothetical protein